MTFTPPDWLLFLGKFLKHGTTIASFVPSSVWLAQAMLKGLDLKQAQVVVELGAGTGPITAELLRQAPASCRCVIVERDADFCARLRERFPQAEIVQADACALDELLNQRGVGAVDHFLCGLPLPSFPAAARDVVLGCITRRLRPNGRFRQLTHMPWVYQRLYRHHFNEVQFRLVFRNLPPAGYYDCRLTGVQ